MTTLVRFGHGTAGIRTIITVRTEQNSLEHLGDEHPVEIGRVVDPLGFDRSLDLGQPFERSEIHLDRGNTHGWSRKKSSTRT